MVEIFEDFTRQCVENFGSLLPLDYASRTTTRLSGLPSWVPDFSATVGPPDLFVVTDIPGNSTKVDIPTLQASRRGQLILKGEIVASVGPVGPIGPSRHKSLNKDDWPIVRKHFVREVDKYLEDLGYALNYSRAS